MFISRIIRRNMRNPQDLQSDPQFPYRVGQLVGAAEMMSVYMSLHGDHRAKEMATRVHNLLTFFLTEEEQHQLPELPPSSAPTPSTAVNESDTLLMSREDVETVKRLAAEGR
jgi:hypothetical protein